MAREGAGGMALDLIVRNTSEVLALQEGQCGAGTEGAEAALRPLSSGVVGVQGGRVAYLGPESELPPGAVTGSTEVLDAEGGFVGPGFVDPHTHLVFAGERSLEFDLRCQGRSYLELAAAGGGIASTVRATREATEDALVEAALPRLRRLLQEGITTAEVKSGYGLDVETELKMLRVVQRLGELQPVTLIPTLLCAHAIPPEHKGSRGRYIDLCVEKIIPEVGRQGLARFCDAFLEEGALTRDEVERVLRAGLDAGLRPRLHADQLTAGGGAELAAELGASTADHLEHVSDAGIEALLARDVTGLLVPTSTLFLRHPQWAPGRKMRDAGVQLALATNVNPGSAMSESLSLAMGLACLYNGLSAAEAYWGATRGGARALGVSEAGRLYVGGPADFVVFGCGSYRHLPYHLGVSNARTVVKAGQVVARREV